ncbi:MAG: histidine phosphatase family protein [Chloroflexota bacterium]
MKTIEIRRHSMRTAGQPHLSQQGVTLARLVGQNLGPFDRVITSALPRAFETAIAMGFAVDEQSELMSTYGADVEAEVPWPQTFEVYADAFKRGRAVTKYGKKLEKFYRELEDYLPGGRAALVINHGGIVEMGAVACLTEAGFEVRGEAVNYCEGVRLFWDDGRCVSAEIIRVSI